MTDELTPKELIVLALNDALCDKYAKLDEVGGEMLGSYIGDGRDLNELTEKYNEIEICIARTRAALDAARKMP